MTEYDESATCWHILTRTYGGTVSILKNLDAPTARQAYRKLRPHERPERFYTERREVEGSAAALVQLGGWGSFNTSSPSAIEQVDVLGPEGCNLDPWRGVEPVYWFYSKDGSKRRISAAEYEHLQATEPP